MEVSEIEWRSFIKISVLLKKSSSDIYRDLCLALGDEAPSRTTVFEWAARFSHGRQSVADDSREGRPRTSRTEANIEAARQLLDEYPQITLEEIAESLGISHGSAQAIVTDDLKFKKLFAKWIPHNLTLSQMAERKDMAAYLLRKLRTLRREGQKNIATGDETWLYMDMPVSEPTSKRILGRTLLQHTKCTRISSQSVVSITQQR